MTEFATRQPTAVTSTMRVLVVLEAAIFLLAALQHLGYTIPLGFVLLAEPRILPAALVEGSSGLLFVVSAYALFTGRDWSWVATLVTHVYALGGVLLGIFALAMSFGPRTSTNDIYHMIMLLLLMPGLALLLGGNHGAADSIGTVFFHWLIRITGLVQIYLGVLFWLIQDDALIPFHILVGSILVLSLWMLAFLAAQIGVDWRWSALAIVWGFMVVILGLTQTQILPGPAHWVIQVLHLLVGLGAIGQEEGLSARVRRIQGRAF
jgi:hypothetical protein